MPRQRKRGGELQGVAIYSIEETAADAEPDLSEDKPDFNNHMPLSKDELNLKG